MQAYMGVVGHHDKNNSKSEIGVIYWYEAYLTANVDHREPKSVNAGLLDLGYYVLVHNFA